jgi:dipeptidyl-peptidase-3
MLSASRPRSLPSGGLSDEFSYSEYEKARNREFGALAQLLRVDMHEVIGHASGQINPGVGTPNETLKSYSSALEEARADLVAMYYILDPKLVELGLMPSLEVGKAAYDSQIKNGLQLQLRRVELGNDIEQAHMRNRQLIAAWAYEMGLENSVIEKVEKDGKHYFVINDYEALRGIFAEQLREIQRIKSEGDFDAGQALVETYGVKVDRAMHEEVLARVEPLNIAPYKGFIQPRMMAVEENGEIVDVKVEPTDDFLEWMLESEEKYSFLPVTN